MSEKVEKKKKIKKKKKKKKQKIEYKCEDCEKEFQNKTDLTRHINRKYPCTGKIVVKMGDFVKEVNEKLDKTLKKVKIMKQEIDDMKQIIIRMESKMDNNNKTDKETNSKSIKSTTKNELKKIEILDFNFEEKRLPLDELREILEKSKDEEIFLINIIKNSYINEDKLERNSIYVKTDDKKKLETFEDDKWKERGCKDALDDMFRGLMVIIKKYMDEQPKLVKSNGWFQVDVKHKIKEKEFYNKVLDLLYENRNISEKTRYHNQEDETDENEESDESDDESNNSDDDSDDD
jgi:hypothetical protein